MGAAMARNASIVLCARSGIAGLALAASLIVATFAAGAQSPPPPAVTAAKPVVRDIVEDDEFVGRFEAVDEVSVRSRVGGYLQSIHFEDGRLVKSGDLLFTIDRRPFESALNQARASLEVANTLVTFTKTSVRTRRKTVGQRDDPHLDPR